MTVNVIFFASLREALGISAESVDLPAAITQVGTLREFLAARGGVWEELVTRQNLRAAVNQQLVGWDAPVKDDDEVAFFPPVTGG